MYEQIKKTLISKPADTFHGIQFSSFEQKLLVDAFEDLIIGENNDSVVPTLSKTNTIYFYSLVEKIRLEILKLKTKAATSIDQIIHLELLNELGQPEVEKRLIYVLAAHETILIEAGYEEVIQLAKQQEAYHEVTGESENDLVADLVTDLFFNTPDLSAYMQGEYKKSVKIFKFCRQNRLYPCLMVMKDINGNALRKQDGTLWTNPSLASARTGLPSYQRNGNTPVGIFTIDSVMPVADQQLSYGKFRRMILNFIPASENETLFKTLLPKSSWDQDWWKPSIVARDIGRNLFRIHGSGKINTELDAPYFPFMRTLGCIAQRENAYNGVTYKDQRDLLDTIMITMDLSPKYENEPKIKGILYIIELNNINVPVTLKDLKEYGIE